MTPPHPSQVLLCNLCPELVTKQIWVLFSLYFHNYLTMLHGQNIGHGIYSHDSSRGCRVEAGADWDLLPPVGNLL